MQPEHAVQALHEASQSVLESMFFVSAEETGPPDEWENPMIFAQVEFRGQWAGRCIAQMPESLARTLAGNFAGLLDPEEVRAEIMIETVCEFVNMICGCTITRLGCSGIVALSPPHLIEEWPVEGANAQAPAERWLDTGEGTVHVSFETEALA
jgi:CheY-specific phosphatase CheX